MTETSVAALWRDNEAGLRLTPARDRLRAASERRTRLARLPGHRRANPDADSAEILQANRAFSVRPRVKGISS